MDYLNKAMGSGNKEEGQAQQGQSQQGGEQKQEGGGGGFLSGIGDKMFVHQCS